MSLVDRALAELRATIAPRQSVEPVQGMTPEAAYSVGLPDGVGLYVHVPFCEALCRFCPYNKVRLEAGRTDRYVHALRREVALLTPLLRKARPGSLYFGGGTPTLLPSLVEEIIGRAQDFGLRGEVATEVHPRHASPPLLTRLRQAGVSYVSVGVQSFDDRVLSYLGRDHDAQGAIRGLEAALAAGFACVDADLMFDVVRFGEDRVVQDAEIAFSLGVDQLSVYPMMRFDGDPQHDEPAEKRALQRIAQAGGKLGYARTSVWTFGKNPKHRYSSITRDRYVGLGPSGSSLVDGGQFYVNTFDVDTYAQLTDSGRLPIAAHIDLVSTTSSGVATRGTSTRGASATSRHHSCFSDWRAC
jgi:coproporphyrinogen III oxidase-like Fe-S oxidoreductase